MDHIRTVELFAGVGGFRAGLERASEHFQVIWAVQWEPYAADQYAFDCYTAHFGRLPSHVCKDITVAKKHIPDHDLLVGGFPCQDYSIANKNARGIEGSKGILWWQIDDIILEKRPPYILLENVDRLIRSPSRQRGRDLSIMLRCLYEAGYAVEWRVINAADYGQAQRRRRTFIFAYHNSTKQFKIIADAVCTQGLKAMHRTIMEDGLFAKAFSLDGHSRNYMESWIDELEYADLSDLSLHQQAFFYPAGMMMNGRIYSVEVFPKYEPPIPLRDILVKGPVDDHYFLKSGDMSKWSYAKGAKQIRRKRRDGSGYIFSEGEVPFPDPLDRPSRTILTSESQISRCSHVVEDPTTGKLRVLTPTECERLNGFPDGWTDTGMSERARYFVMGNSLVVPLVARLGGPLSSIVIEGRLDLRPT